MRNVVVLLLVSVVIVLLSVSLFPLSLESKKSVPARSNSGSLKEEPESNLPVNEPVAATFLIYLHGLPKELKNADFFNQSSRVFISTANPRVVQVKTLGVTWDDFFETLPMTFSKECLVSEVNQEFCTYNDLKLYYYLNGKEEEDIFSKEIKNGDKLLVTYGDLTKAEINYQLSQF